MGGTNGQMSLMDALAIVSFLIGVANYGENVSQGQMQETVSSAVEDVHSHLQTQDDKIDYIISLLKEGERDGSHGTETL